jgi:hypothetical protein
VVVLVEPEGDLAAIWGPNRRNVTAISGNGIQTAVISDIPYRPFFVGQADAKITVVGNDRAIWRPGGREAMGLATEILKIAILQPYQA